MHSGQTYLLLYHAKRISPWFMNRQVFHTRIMLDLARIHNFLSLPTKPMSTEAASAGQHEEPDSPKAPDSHRLVNAADAPRGARRVEDTWKTRERQPEFL